MPHWVLALGAIVAFLNAIYTIWEKGFRQRPRAWPSRSSSPKHPGRMVIRVKNPGEQDIVVIGTRIKPKVYNLANSWEFDQLIDATLDNSGYRIVAPGKTVELPLSTIRDKNGIELDKVDEPVSIRIYWRRSASMWLPRIPLCLGVKTGEITLMSAAEIGGED